MRGIFKDQLFHVLTRTVYLVFSSTCCKTAKIRKRKKKANFLHVCSFAAYMQVYGRFAEKSSNVSRSVGRYGGDLRWADNSPWLGVGRVKTLNQ